MNFDQFESSADLGEPVNLYKFVYGPESEDFYAYTDAEQPLVFETVVYYPRVIARNDISSSGTTDKSTLTVTLPNTDAMAELFRVYPPSFPVSVILWQGHIGADDFALQFTGKVLSCSRDGETDATLTCEPSSVSMQRIGLRRNYQYMCPHVLYGDQCRADKAAATITASVGSVSGRQVVLTGLLTNEQQFAGGIAEWLNDQGLREYRTILRVEDIGGASRLTFSGIARDVEAGGSLALSKGCAHNLTACALVHNNVPNYGGQPYIPTKNPLGRTTPFL